MEILNEIQNIFRDIFDDENLLITPETSAKDIEDWDSMAQIQLVVTIEKHFKIRFSLEELQGLQKVGEVLDIIKKKKK